MKLNDIVQIANQAYDRGDKDLIGGYWDFKTGMPRFGEDGKLVETFKMAVIMDLPGISLSS